MRFLVPLVALCALSSAPLRAGIFDITLSGSLSGSGALSTDGLCGFCVPGAGLLSLTINIGPDSGPDAFDISDDNDMFAGPPVYSSVAKGLGYNATNSETQDVLHMLFTGSGAWTLERPGVVDRGTYSITPAIPEPPSLFLLTPILALVGLRWRHQRHRA
jgi:hypothetical protein